jgi:hypothetical protein
VQSRSYRVASDGSSASQISTRSRKRPVAVSGSPLRSSRASATEDHVRSAKRSFPASATECSVAAARAATPRKPQRSARWKTAVAIVRARAFLPESSACEARSTSNESLAHDCGGTSAGGCDSKIPAPSRHACEARTAAAARSRSVTARRASSASSYASPASPQRSASFARARVPSAGAIDSSRARASSIRPQCTFASASEASAARRPVRSRAIRTRFFAMLRISSENPRSRAAQKADNSRWNRGS